MVNPRQAGMLRTRWNDPEWAAKTTANMRKAHARRRAERPRPYPIELVAGRELRLLPLSALLEGLTIEDRRMVYVMAGADQGVLGFVRIETPEELEIVAFGLGCRFTTVEAAVDYAGLGANAFARV